MKIRRRTPKGLAVLAGLSVPLSLCLPVAQGGDTPNRTPPMTDALAERLRHLTLDDAIDIALHRNPQIQNQLQEIQRLQGVFVQVRAAALPHVVATGTFSAEDRALLGSTGTVGTTTSTVGTGTGTVGTGTGTVGTGTGTVGTGTGTTGTTGAATSLNNLGLVTVNTATGAAGPTIPLSALSTPTENNLSYTIQVEVQQTVYNASIPPAIRQARFLRDAAYYNLRETVDTTVNNVKTEFYTVLVDKALIDIQNESLRLLQAQLTDEQNRFAAGTVPRFDVLQASVAVANQRPLVIQANNNYALSFIGLARTLGVEYGPIQEKIAPLHLVGNLDYHPQNFSPELGVAAGKANRALLKQQQLNILSAVEQIRINAAGYQPVVIGQGGLESRSNEISDNLGNTLNGWFAGASFNWNIFDGLATYGAVKQAKAQLREARITYLDSVNGVVEDIQNNYLTLKQSQELIASQVLNVSEAEEAVRLAQARLSAGAGTQLDVLQSQTSLLQAQTTELQARYNYAVALGNYERVTGTSTVYDEAFIDPLSNRRFPTGVDATGTTPQGKQLPQGFIKTPATVQRGSGRPIDQQINAQDPNVPAKESKGPVGRFVSGEDRTQLSNGAAKGNRSGKSDQHKKDDDNAKKKPLKDRAYLLGN